jgi:hypothetical protein
MAFVTADRVLDTSTSTGTGAFVVSGTAPSGYRTFSAVLSTNDTCYYSIGHQTLSEWETGTATYSSANTLTRTTIASSSNANAAVNFSAGTKDVSITFLASKSLQADPSGQTVNSSGSYIRTTITATAGQTSFTANYTVNYVEVYVNGILLNSTDYTATTGTTVVLAAAAAAGDIVDVLAINIGTFTGGVTITGTPTNGQIATWTGSTSLQGTTILPTANGGTGASLSPTTAGNTIFSTDGTNWSSTQKIVQSTAVTLTTQTAVDFTSIPSWVKRITIMFRGASLSGTSSFLVQIGSGSFTTSGYISTSNGANQSSATGGINSTAGFCLRANSAAGITSGMMVLTSLGSNAWVETHTSKNATTEAQWGGGDVALGGVLDRVRITTVNGTDTFDAGSVNILYE